MLSLKKVLLGVGGVGALGVLGGLAYLGLALPKTLPPENFQARSTPARLARGKYLVQNVASCLDCHSKRDWTKFSGPLVSGTYGMGGERFDRSQGLPGEIYSRNITPAAIGHWSDGELLRAVTSGVNASGRALFPIMPYPLYSELTRGDAESIVIYLRTLAPIVNPVSETKLDFPMNLIVRTMPVPARFDRVRSLASAQDRGKYLGTIGGCIECHTLSVQGKRAEGMEYAGGFAFPFPGGVTRSSNLTPDAETGIGLWSKQAFVDRFKKHEPVAVGPNDFNTPMPWTMYQGMTGEDLGDLYDYLRSLKPKKSLIQKWTRGERL